MISVLSLFELNFVYLHFTSNCSRFSWARDFRIARVWLPQHCALKPFWSFVCSNAEQPQNLFMHCSVVSDHIQFAFEIEKDQRNSDEVIKCFRTKFLNFEDGQLARVFFLVCFCFNLVQCARICYIDFQSLAFSLSQPLGKRKPHRSFLCADLRCIYMEQFTLNWLFCVSVPFFFDCDLNPHRRAKNHLHHKRGSLVWRWIWPSTEHISIY